MSSKEEWRPSIAEQAVDPARFWIRYRPRRWPGASWFWVDLSSGQLGGSRSRADGLPKEWRGPAIDDVVYLPPVPEALRSDRDALVRSLIKQDTPILVQLGAFERPAIPEVSVFDLFEPLLSNDLDALARLPEGSTVIWPLVAGYTDSESIFEQGLECLRKSGVRVVQSVAVQLEPSQRRRIVERSGEEGFEALFHGAPPLERELDRLSVDFGFEIVMARPVPRNPNRLRSNRSLAEVLYRYAEVWLGLGRSEAKAQSIYASARRLDNESHDIGSLCREGNLNIVEWLDTDSARIVQEWVDTGRSTDLTEIEAAYADFSG